MPTHVAWSSLRWRQYFVHNASNLIPVPWESKARISTSQREAITTSIQEFQLGESSEGRHLLTRGRQYATRAADEDYAPALVAFIAEENRHARDLGRFMEMEGIEKVRKAWPDTVFRWLRHRAGLELSIVVLVTAEIIAKIYYVALHDATDSPVLRALCEQILHDEEAHVRFQSERIAILRRQRMRWLVPVLDAFHRMLFAGTCMVVWYKHGRALRAGGFRLARFWQESWRERNAAADIMNPRLIDFGEVDVHSGTTAMTPALNRVDTIAAAE